MRRGSVRAAGRGGREKQGSVPPSALSLSASETGRRGWARRRGSDRLPACAPDRWYAGCERVGQAHYVRAVLMRLRAGVVVAAVISTSTRAERGFSCDVSRKP